MTQCGQTWGFRASGKTSWKRVTEMSHKRWVRLTW
jgi:hypothetical protein